jgi:hypothetical protein
MLRRHPGERGQTLVLAIAFLGMFGLFAAAVLGFASTVQGQRGPTERTAAVDSVTEGSAQFAMSDTDLQGCGTVSSGTMKFPPAAGQTTGDTLSYANVSCGSSSSTAPGQNCSLCVLNFPSDSKPVNVAKGNWTIPGEVDVNGSISVKSITSGTRIGQYPAGSTCGDSCSPAPTVLTSQVYDPLGGVLPVPTPASNPPDAAGSPSGTTLCPGTYHDLSVNNNQNLLLSGYGQNGCASSSAPSVFIVTGTMSNSGGGNIFMSAATLYLTPAAAIDLEGNSGGQVSLDCGANVSHPTCGTPDTPTAGPYAGIAVFVDAQNVSQIKFNGNENFTVAGTFEASHAILNMGGNGGTHSFQNGRLIISELQGNGNGGASLGFSGVITATSCLYWNDSLVGTLGDGTSQPGRVRFEASCNGSGPSAIISFAYGSGP